MEFANVQQRFTEVNLVRYRGILETGVEALDDNHISNKGLGSQQEFYVRVVLKQGPYRTITEEQECNLHYEKDDKSLSTLSLF